MSMKHFLFTSESVAEGHPDKVADQISDGILDAIIRKTRLRGLLVRPWYHGACLRCGEITTSSWIDIPEIVRTTIRDIGYNDSSMGFDWETCAVISSIDKQSLDIAVGVNPGEDFSKNREPATRVDVRVCLQ